MDNNNTNKNINNDNSNIERISKTIKYHPSTREHMQIKENQGVPYLKYPLFKQFDFIKHGFSTRLGGVSKGIYSTMNLSFTRGDDEAAVRENYQRMAAALEIAYDRIVTSDQTHTTNVRVVTEVDAGKGLVKPRDYQDIDGLITNVPGLTLATFYADCVPLYFVDPVHKCIGLSHSGWRGTVAKMGKVTVEAMRENFGSKASDIYTAIGPSICQDCYEVSEDVAEEFAAVFPANEVLKKGRKTKEGQKWQLDLWRANELVLLEAGIPENQIALPGICTCCNPELLFSHRASHGKRGNLGAFLQISK